MSRWVPNNDLPLYRTEAGRNHHKAEAGPRQPPAKAQPAALLKEIQGRNSKRMGQVYDPDNALILDFHFSEL